MTTIITATEITDEQERLNFTSSMFSKYFFEGELTTYGFMDALSEDYCSGIWRFYTLSNGGYYMAPCQQKPMKMAWSDNYYSGSMSDDAAGITASLFSLSHLSVLKQDEFLSERFLALRDFAAEHKEASQIFRAID